MADPKYANLPGIDLSNDMYECGDLPEDDQNWISDELKSDSVENENINTKTAFTKFNVKSVSVGEADFSGKIGMPNLGYDMGDFELVGEGEVETATQKVQRLKLEVSQIAQEHAGGNKVLPSDLLASISQMQTQLASKDASGGVGDDGGFEKLLSILNEVARSKEGATLQPGARSLSEAQGSYSLMMKSDQTQKYSSKISEIEQRIAKIEQAVGIDSDRLAVLTSQSKENNLKAAVDSLEMKKSLLDPDKLPLIDTRLQAVLMKLNEIKKVRQQQGPADQNLSVKKITELYEIVQKWDSVSSSLPSVVNRLETLNLLHQQAGDFSSTIKHMENLQNQIMSKVTHTSTMAKQLESAFQQNSQNIQANLNSLEKRLEELKP